MGSLRPKGPVTCGFGSWRPALSRRPRAVGAGTSGSLGRARARAKARGRYLPPSVGVQFVPILTSFARRADMPRLTSAGIVVRKPSALARAYPRAASRRSVFVAMSLRSRMASFISELASLEVPGFGAPALPSAPGLQALAPASAIARDHGVSASGQRWRSCLRRHGKLLASQVPRRGRLYPYKGTRGARIVSARRGELMGSFRGVQVRRLFKVVENREVACAHVVAAVTESANQRNRDRGLMGSALHSRTS